MSLDFLGKGLKHPFTFQRRSGGAQVSTATSHEHAHIHESIHQILGTRPGERFMRPEFGARLRDLAFEANDEVLRALVRHWVIDALRRWEKRIVITDVQFDDGPESRDGHVLRVRIHYRVIASQTEGNLVFPYYLP